MTRTIGAILMALAVIAVILAIWWGDFRSELFLFTAALLYLIGDSLLDAIDDKKDDQ